MIGCADEMQGTFVTTDAIIPLALLLSVIMFVVADDMSDAAPDDQVLGLADGPISGELLLDRTLSAELDALLRMDSSLDDFKSSFSRSSSLRGAAQRTPSKRRGINVVNFEFNDSRVTSRVETTRWKIKIIEFTSNDNLM